MKRLLALMLAVLTVFSLCACGGHISSLNDTPALKDAKKITLNGDKISTEGGASVSGTTVTVSAPGIYAVSGTLNNGQIVIDTGDDAGKVTLLLNGASVTNLEDAAIYVKKADKLTIHLVKDTENTLVSGREGSAPTADDASGAAIYSKDDLKFEGSGALNVCGWINNGIAGKHDVDFEGGVINVTAVNNGVRGAYSVEIKGGVLNVASGNDGIKSTVTDKDGKGYINISGGVVNVSSLGDGVSAATDFDMSGGVLTVNTIGDADDMSSKAVKADGNIKISGGTVALDSTDSAIVCGGDLTVNGGAVNIKTLKTGIKLKTAAQSFALNGGVINIDSGKKCFDVLGDVKLNGGTLKAVGTYKTAPVSFGNAEITTDDGKTVIKFN